MEMTQSKTRKHKKKSFSHLLIQKVYEKQNSTNLEGLFTADCRSY
jgi:hypothetical protein